MKSEIEIYREQDTTYRLFTTKREKETRLRIPATPHARNFARQLMAIFARTIVILTNISRFNVDMARKMHERAIQNENPCQMCL